MEKERGESKRTSSNKSVFSFYLKQKGTTELTETVASQVEKKVFFISQKYFVYNKTY